MATDSQPLAGDLIQAVEQLSETFAGRSIQYALVGGLATTMRARPRFTQDVDVLLEVPQLVLAPLLDDLSRRGFTLNVATVVREYVHDHLTAFRFGTVRIDWLKPVLPLYSHVLAAATELPWTAGHRLRVATAEGLILTKMIAFRQQDQADIATLLAANQADIDVELIRREWQPYAALEPARTAWLEATFAGILRAKGS